MFGIWDGLAPLVGGLVGKYLGEAVEPLSDYIGPAVMGAHGVYLLVRSLRSSASEELDHPWALFGIPLSLSPDYVARHIIGVMCPAALCARPPVILTGAMPMG
jgi:manganese efflux pump family protein